MTATQQKTPLLRQHLPRPLRLRFVIRGLQHTSHCHTVQDSWHKHLCNLILAFPLRGSAKHTARGLTRWIVCVLHPYYDSALVL